ncbi:hypothetical protein HMPREF0658_0071 [Hoylesella marshii DSM 16973 = JCM 13450]|uniref:Uncharacterized protein n=1 Tax=Hoylesella marshii DSM 16973 = JCM 13450 TaxID=862515 RepID=E0NPH0_9BACT|nr:hypothetical protein HMPREF0658_0071 [Hoylesella marshii DSM 16973 = JCM 13450]
MTVLLIANLLCTVIYRMIKKRRVSFSQLVTMLKLTLIKE